MLHAVDTLELCLVCEVCWRPQRDGAYEVTTKSDLCVKVRAPWGPWLRDPQLQKGAIALCDDACASGYADCKSNALHDQGGKWAGRHRTVLLARHRGRFERHRGESYSCLWCPCPPVHTEPMHEVFCSLIGQLITLAAQQTRVHTCAGVPTIPKEVLERGSVLLTRSWMPLRLSPSLTLCRQSSSRRPRTRTPARWRAAACASSRASSRRRCVPHKQAHAMHAALS